MSLCRQQQQQQWRRGKQQQCVLISTQVEQPPLHSCGTIAQCDFWEKICRWDPCLFGCCSPSHVFRRGLHSSRYWYLQYHIVLGFLQRRSDGVCMWCVRFADNNNNNGGNGANNNSVLLSQLDCFVFCVTFISDTAFWHLQRLHLAFAVYSDLHCCLSRHQFLRQCVES